MKLSHRIAKLLRIQMPACVSANVHNVLCDRDLPASIHPLSIIGRFRSMAKVAHVRTAQDCQ